MTGAHATGRRLASLLTVTTLAAAGALAQTAAASSAVPGGLVTTPATLSATHGTSVPVRITTSKDTRAIGDPHVDPRSRS